jgi:hypothetical protein
MDYCAACSNTGRYKQPNDNEEFDRLFEKYDRPGTMNMHECYNILWDMEAENQV